MWESSDPVPKGELLLSVRGVEALLCTSSDEIDRDILESAGKFPKGAFDGCSCLIFVCIYIQNKRHCRLIDKYYLLALSLNNWFL